MKYNIPPKKLRANGKTYTLFVEEYHNDGWDGWCSYVYQENKDSIPPEATDGHEVYFLCSMESSKMKAEEDMLDRLNKMTKIVPNSKQKEKKKN